MYCDKGLNIVFQCYAVTCLYNLFGLYLCGLLLDSYLRIMSFKNPLCGTYKHSDGGG